MLDGSPLHFSAQLMTTVVNPLQDKLILSSLPGEGQLPRMVQRCQLPNSTSVVVLKIALTAPSEAAILREKCALEAIANGVSDHIVRYYGFVDNSIATCLVFENVLGVTLLAWITDLPPSKVFASSYDCFPLVL